MKFPLTLPVRTFLEHAIVPGLLLAVFSFVPIGTAAADQDLCDFRPVATIPVSSEEFSIPKTENAVSVYRRFMAERDLAPTVAEVIGFFQSLSVAVLDLLEVNPPSAQKLLSYAYQFRLALSTAQEQHCVSPAFFLIYDDFLMRLRQFKINLDYRAKTLEGFLFQQEGGAEDVDQADADFIDRHMVDTPLNRAFKARILAYSSVPAIRNSSLPTLCRELERMGMRPEPVTVDKSDDELSIHLTDLGCHDLDTLGDAPAIALADDASLFSVLRTNGKNIVVRSRTRVLPAFDLSNRKPPQRLSPIEPALKRPCYGPNRDCPANGSPRRVRAPHSRSFRPRNYHPSSLPQSARRWGGG